MLIGMAFKPFPGKDYLLLFLATVVIAWPGRRFFVSAWKQLRHGSANMDTLVALSVGVSYLFSLFNLSFPDVWTSRGLEAHTYFESCTMIVAFILLGRLLEEKAKHGTTASIRKLMGLKPQTVVIQRVEVVDGLPSVREITIPTGEVKQGDVVIVNRKKRIVHGMHNGINVEFEKDGLSPKPASIKKVKSIRKKAGWNFLTAQA
jgi:Cu2+-exporting ATPase